MDAFPAKRFYFRYRNFRKQKIIVGKFFIIKLYEGKIFKN